MFSVPGVLAVLLAVLPSACATPGSDVPVYGQQESCKDIKDELADLTGDDRDTSPDDGDYKIYQDDDRPLEVYCTMKATVPRTYVEVDADENYSTAKNGTASVKTHYSKIRLTDDFELDPTDLAFSYEVVSSNETAQSILAPLATALAIPGLDHVPLGLAFSNAQAAAKSRIDLGGLDLIFVGDTLERDFYCLTGDAESIEADVSDIQIDVVAFGKSAAEPPSLVRPHCGAYSMGRFEVEVVKAETP